MAASDNVAAKGFGFEVAKGFEFAPKFDENGLVDPEEKGFLVGVPESEPPKSCAPMFGCGLAVSGSGVGLDWVIGFD